jgi:hypothetical protein
MRPRGHSRAARQTLPTGHDLFAAAEVVFGDGAGSRADAMAWPLAAPPMMALAPSSRLRALSPARIVGAILFMLDISSSGLGRTLMCRDLVSKGASQCVRSGRHHEPPSLVVSRAVGGLRTSMPPLRRAATRVHSIASCEMAEGVRVLATSPNLTSSFVVWEPLRSGPLATRIGPEGESRPSGARIAGHLPITCR